MYAKTLIDESATRITRRSLHEELSARLRDMIVEGALPAGSKVPEKTLCERFGVSRTPLREALKVLASEGLVSLNPNKGASITPLTRSDLEEVFPILGTLEALAGELACSNMKDEEIHKVQIMHRRMVESFKAQDRQTYFKINQAIHAAILEGSRNLTLIGTHQTLAGRIRRARYMANDDPPRWAAAVEEHEKILAALQRRDGADLSALLRMHMTKKLASVLKHFEHG
jgi:DNA-binding GntR family transcriptional regulator